MSQSFSESVKAIVNGNGSKTTKVESLVKVFGLSKHDAEMAYTVYSEHTPRVVRERFAYTFGVEIECNMPRNAFEIAASNNHVNYLYDRYGHEDSVDRYRLVTDGSLRGDNPIECVTPILNSQNGGMNSLKACLKAMNGAGASVNKSCGLHVHIGAANLTSEQYANVFKNYAKLEKVIDSFMAYSRRNNNAGYAKSIIGKVENCRTREDIMYAFCGNRRPTKESGVWRGPSRYYKVNAMSYVGHKTIEYRQHAGSVNFDKISHWIKFCAKLTQFSMNNVIDHEIESINDIPFLTAAEKRYFISRKEELARRNAA